jgi:hypothetical protein
MAPAKGDTLYRCITPGGVFVVIKGREYHIKQGDLVREGHEFLKALPGHFELAEDVVRPDIEQATKAPGTKRGQ